MTLSLRTEQLVAPAARLTIDEDLVAPTALQRELFQPANLGTPLLNAVADLVDEGMTAGGARTTLEQAHSVDALDGAYAALAVGALRSDMEAARFVATTRHLGSQLELGIQSTLDDIETGPTRVFAASDYTPDVALELPPPWFELPATQRRRFLRHLHRLIPGVDVALIVSRLGLRKLLRAHSDQLPASVSESAQARLEGSSAPTRTAATRERARDVLAERGLNHVDWHRLATLLEPTSEQRSYDALQADPRLDVSRDALRQFARRCRDDGLVETITNGDQTCLSLTPLGLAALREHPDVNCDGRMDSPISSAVGSTEDTGMTPESTASPPSQPHVSSPPNSDEGTVLSRTRGIEGEDRPAEEPSQAAAEGTDTATSRTLETSFASLDEHHAIAAASPSSGFATLTRSLATDNDARDGVWSCDHDREEVVVQVQASSLMAHTATRLCAALLSDKALQQVLTPDNLDGGPANRALHGLAIDNHVVLQNVACLGWLPSGADGKKLQSILEQEKNDLLASTPCLDENADSDELATHLQRAHGLFGTVVRLYDLLGYDVVVDVEVPEYLSSEPAGREALVRYLTKATAVASRYGAYSANRVLFEDRPDKRAQLLAKPNVDVTDPLGTANPRWVLSGPDVDVFQEELAEADGTYPLQSDAMHFAEFLLNLDVVDGNRRAAIATVATRLCSFKNLRETQAVVSTLQALTSDVFAAAQALHRLPQEDDPRELDHHDLRYALSFIDATDLVPDIGGETVSKVVHTLLDADRTVSSTTLADLAGTTTQTLRNNDNHFAALEAVGLLDRQEGGPGEPTTWRLRLPFDDERFDEDAPIPSLVEDGDRRLHDAVFDILDNLAERLDEGLDIDWGGDLVLEVFSPFPQRQLSDFLTVHPRFGGLFTLVSHLLGTVPPDYSEPSSMMIGADPRPDLTQQSLREVG